MEHPAELVFIATPFMGHMVAQVELARHLLPHLPPPISITILIPKLPNPEPNLQSYLQSTPLPNRISFFHLPELPQHLNSTSIRPFALIDLLARLYTPIVTRILTDRGIRTLGIVFDMLATRFADVADELRVPSYVFFTSGANLLSMMLELEARGVHAESGEMEVPGFRNKLPVGSWPEIVLDEGNVEQFLMQATRYRKCKGILVNTYLELERDILLSFSEDGGCPPVYSVGPSLNLGVRVSGVGVRDPVLCWLDGQPSRSVVFMCFGSKNATFEKEQVEQIATGIEKSGHRFLWSLQPHPNSGSADYESLLPAGFMERTSKVGKMIGWAPQTQVLAHPAVGAFVSHCGWNSVLESLWFGVPVVAWPMYGEQQLNAFWMVREMGMAVEVRLDYRYDLVRGKGSVVVDAEEVERAIRRVMEEEEEGVVVRRKVERLSLLGRRALGGGGSSEVSLRCFAEDVIKNVG